MKTIKTLKTISAMKTIKTLKTISAMKTNAMFSPSRATHNTPPF